MNFAVTKLFFGGFSMISVMLSCCTTSQLKTSKKWTGPAQANRSSKSDQEMVELILALPENQYHEENREAFVNRLQKSRSVPQNLSASENYFYVPGDGTFHPHEYYWDPQAKALTVKCAGDSVDPPSTDTWRQVAGNWSLAQ